MAVGQQADTDRTSPPPGLAQLRERYRQTSGRNMTAIERLAQQLAQRPTAPEIIDALRRELHRFRGTAGSYGFIRASELAEALETRAAAWTGDPRLEPEHRAALVTRFAGEVREALADGADGGDTPHALGSANDAAPVDPAVEDPVATPGGLAGFTVLVVDDDPFILELVSGLLAAERVKVVQSSDASALVDLLDDVRPDLLLLDMQLDGADGIALTRAVRAVPALRDLPILIVSGTTFGPEVRQEVYAAGADGFIHKPIVPGELQHRVTEQLSRVRARRVERGLHPVTGLPHQSNTPRLAAAAFAAARAQGRTCAAALIRPVLLEPTAEAAATWFGEVRRIARELARDASVVIMGHDDEWTILALVEGDADRAAALCHALHTTRPAGAPEWRAAIVDSAQADLADAGAMRLAAADLLASSPTGEGAVVRWRPDATRQAPEIIIVEDDSALADMLEYAMRAAGISYRVFSDGISAIDEMLRMRVYGTRPVVLLDVNLPGVDGHSLYERLRVERPGVFAVVFMTVRASEVEQVRALRAGAVDYLPKPLNLRILMAKLPHWLGRPVGAS